MNKKYIVKLTPVERQELEQLIASGKAAARKLSHARILLKADISGPGWDDTKISEALEVHIVTVERVRKLFVLEGLDQALNRRPTTRQYQRKLDGKAEAHLVAIACKTPPKGHKRWTVRLLADRLVELEIVDDISHVSVWHTLKKTNLSLG